MARKRTPYPANHSRRLRVVAVALGIGAFIATSGAVHAKQPGELPSNVKLQQWETKPQGGWITGALNSNNSDYVEGQVVPFRLEIPANVNADSYQFSVCRNYEDGTRRGYLYHAPFNTDRPADPGGTISSTQDGFAAVNATLDSVADAGGQGICKSGDREAAVTITKNEGIAYVLWGGHLAAPDDPGVGAGNSAAYWPGASLHMKLLSPSKDVAIQTCIGPSTPTSTYTAAVTTTATVTSSATVTGTVTVTTTPASSPTPVPPATNTPTPTNTATSTATATPTPVDTATPPPGDSPTPTPTTATPPAVRSATPTSTAAPATATASGTAAAATATPTRVSEQAGASTQPRLLPATGTCGNSSGGGNLWLPLLLAGIAMAAAGAAGGIWFVRRGQAAPA